MNNGFLEVPNRLITRKKGKQFVVSKEISYKARILLIGLTDFSKEYSYCSYTNKELEEIMGLSNVSKAISELEEKEYIKIRDDIQVDTRTIKPKYFNQYKHKKFDDEEETAREHFNKKIEEEGFTPIPRKIIFNDDLKYKDRLVYIYLLNLASDKRKCYPTYASMNKVLGLSEKSKTVKKSIKRLANYKINDKKILSYKKKSKGRGFLYFPLVKVLKKDNKYRTCFLNEDDLKVDKVEKTRADLLKENEELKKKVKQLKEELRKEKGIKKVTYKEEEIEISYNDLTKEGKKECSKKRFKNMTEEKLIEGIEKGYIAI